MNPFIELRKKAAARKEAEQIANKDPYADLGEVFSSEQGRGVHFQRDGARIVSPGPLGSADNVNELTPDGIGGGAE